jgi:hypothetical protein
MTSNNLQGIKKCCLSGHLHTGAESGKVEKVAGLDAYVTGTNAAQTVVVITVSGSDWKLFIPSQETALSTFFPSLLGYLWLRGQGELSK